MKSVLLFLNDCGLGKKQFCRNLTLFPVLPPRVGETYCLRLLIIHGLILIVTIPAILLIVSCTHPITKEKTDPFTAFWYSLDGPSNLRTGSFYEDYEPHYHLNHHYQKVIVQQSKPRFASDIEVKND